MFGLENSLNVEPSYDTYTPSSPSVKQGIVNTLARKVTSLYFMCITFGKISDNAVRWYEHNGIFKYEVGTTFRRNLKTRYHDINCSYIRAEISDTLKDNNGEDFYALSVTETDDRGNTSTGVEIHFKTNLELGFLGYEQIRRKSNENKTK